LSDNVSATKVPTPWAVQRCRCEAGKSDGGFPPVILPTAHRGGFQRPAFTGAAASAIITAKKHAIAKVQPPPQK
jgi:hypothetical protein